MGHRCNSECRRIPRCCVGVGCSWVNVGAVVMMGLAWSAIAIIVLFKVFLPEDLGDACLTNDLDLTPTFDLNVTAYRSYEFKCPDTLDACFAGTIDFSFAGGTKTCQYRYAGTYTEVVELLKDMQAQFQLHSIWNGRLQKDKSCALLPQQFVCMVSWEIMLTLVVVAGFTAGSCFAIIIHLALSNCCSRH